MKKSRPIKYYFLLLTCMLIFQEVKNEKLTKETNAEHILRFDQLFLNRVYRVYRKQYREEYRVYRKCHP